MSAVKVIKLKVLLKFEVHHGNLVFHKVFLVAVIDQLLVLGEEDVVVFLFVLLNSLHLWSDYIPI